MVIKSSAENPLCPDALPTVTDFAYRVANEGCVDVSGRRYACTSTEESSSLRASASLLVKTSLCTRATIPQGGSDPGLNGLDNRTYLQVALPSVSPSLRIVAARLVDHL